MAKSSQQENRLAELGRSGQELKRRKELTMTSPGDVRPEPNSDKIAGDLAKEARKEETININHQPSPSIIH